MQLRSPDFKFTFYNLELCFAQVLHAGYDVITCRDYIKYKELKCTHPILVNRVDIDNSVKKAERIAVIFNKLGVKATFFIRLHADYNPFSFENYRILKFIKDSGHEIGYHSEVIDEAIIWQESAADCLIRDIKILETMLNIKIDGVASHGGLTGLNNLDFWRDKSPKQFNLLYEAYDTQPEFDLFNNSSYVSDSNWTHWKCYKQGKLVPGDNRSIAEHLLDRYPVYYSLIHPETYFDNHFYE